MSRGVALGSRVQSPPGGGEAARVPRRMAAHLHPRWHAGTRRAPLSLSSCSPSRRAAEEKALLPPALPCFAFSLEARRGAAQPLLRGAGLCLAGAALFALPGGAGAAAPRPAPRRLQPHRVAVPTCSYGADRGG